MIEDAIMQNIKSNLITNESVKYEPNQLLAQVIGDYITGMGFYYRGFINEPNSDETGIPVNLNVELNGDDVDVLVSPNVMYCFINASNIDYKVETSDNSIYDIANFSEILQATKLVPVHNKVWRDDKNLYLLKINLNTGKIGRYDWRVGRFTTQDINWNNSTPEEVVELLLTKEYLEDYFKHELCSLESYVSFATEEIGRVNESMIRVTKSLNEAKDEEGKWKTMKGSHILVGDDGEIKKGPKPTPKKSDDTKKSSSKYKSTSGMGKKLTSTEPYSSERSEVLNKWGSDIDKELESKYPNMKRDIQRYQKVAKLSRSAVVEALGEKDAKDLIDKAQAVAVMHQKSSEAIRGTFASDLDSDSDNDTCETIMDSVGEVFDSIRLLQKDISDKYWDKLSKYLGG